MTATARWEAWTTDVTISTVNAGDLPRLRSIAEQTIDDVDRACSKFRDDSELLQLAPKLHEGAVVSAVLARIVADALAGARLTDGLVDPTLGSVLHAMGWVAAGSISTPVSLSSDATWRNVRLSGNTLTAPQGVSFDFGATGKASTSDLIVERAVESGIADGALVSLGGDIATSSAAPDGGWVVEIQDLPSDTATHVSLADGAAIATSSTRRRRLPDQTGPASHIIDPRTSQPALDVWGAVTVIAGSCAHANSATTAAIVLGVTAPQWLDARGIPAQLLRRDGSVVHTAHWPRDRKEDRV